MIEASPLPLGRARVVAGAGSTAPGRGEAAVPRDGSWRDQAGYTMIETLMGLMVMGILFGAVALPLRNGILESRLSRAVDVLSSDLERGFSLAERLRRPIRVRCLCPAPGYVVEDRDSTAVYLTRSLGSDEDFRVSSLTFSPASIVVFPTGLASSTLTITLTAGEFTRTLRVTTAGQVWAGTP